MRRIEIYDDSDKLSFPQESRRDFLGRVLVGGAALLLVPSAAVRANESPQPAEGSEQAEIVIPPEFKTFRTIVKDSLDHELLAPFLNKIDTDLSRDTRRHFGIRYELGNKEIPRHFVYGYYPNGRVPTLELVVIDTGGREDVPSTFDLSLQLGKSPTIEGQPNGISLTIPSLFTDIEMVSILGIFKASDRMTARPLFQRLIAYPEGPPGITRGYVGEDGLLRAQDATIYGRATFSGVYLPAVGVGQ